MEEIYELQVPDIGDFQEVPIIEILVEVGDTLTPDTPVVTLESDKASMEVPAEADGVITEILVAIGDTVSEGSLLLRYTGASSTVAAPSAEPAEQTPSVLGREEAAVAPPHPVSSPVRMEPPQKKMLQSGPAGPSVRRLARELGVDIVKVTGSGPKGRLLKEDIRSYVKQVMQNPGMAGNGSIPADDEPGIDFSVFGQVETTPLSRIQKISGTQLAKNWAAIPHVTSFDDADITELDDFRRMINQEQNIKLTLLPFLIKAAQHALRAFPQLNSSLQGAHLVIKKYYHIGFAVDTPGGLLVPVVKDVDSKGLLQIAAEVRELATLAREGRLKSDQMQGGTFTISSLGNIGGTRFTPIINAPEVAIMALGRAAMQPQWDGNQFIPRLILPLSLSWDHRVLDGVTASRFNVFLCRLLADFRRISL
ncbi:MAG: 2-oxo acid dehydrogenase subunit E2 [Desulforhopalus sp.]